MDTNASSNNPFVWNCSTSNSPNSLKLSSIGAVIASEVPSMFYWYSEHLVNDLQSEQLVDITSRHESNWVVNGFSQKVSAHWTGGSVSPRKTQILAAKNAPSGCYQSNTLVDLFYLNSGQVESCTCLYLFMWGFLYVVELALTLFRWSAVCAIQSLQYNPYPSLTATSTPNSLWSWSPSIQVKIISTWRSLWRSCADWLYVWWTEGLWGSVYVYIFCLFIRKTSVLLAPLLCDWFYLGKY